MRCNSGLAESGGVQAEEPFAGYHAKREEAGRKALRSAPRAEP